MAMLFMFVEELRACRICLGVDGKLRDIHASNLAQTFAEVSGTPIAVADGLPQYICSMCCSLLWKYVTFKQKCQRAYTQLHSNLFEHGQITMEIIRNLDSTNLKLPLTVTNLSPISLPENEEVEIVSVIDVNVKKEETFMDIEDYCNMDSSMDIMLEEISDSELKPNVLDVVKTDDPISVTNTDKLHDKKGKLKVAKTDKVKTKTDKVKTITDKVKTKANKVKTITDKSIHNIETPVSQKDKLRQSETDEGNEKIIKSSDMEPNEQIMKDYVKQCLKKTNDENQKKFYEYILNKYLDKTIELSDKPILDALELGDESVKTDSNAVFLNSETNDPDLDTKSRRLFHDYINKKYIKKSKLDVFTSSSSSLVNVTGLRMRKMKPNKNYKTSEELEEFAKTYNYEIIVMTKEQQRKELEARKETLQYKKARFRCEECYRGFRSETVFNTHMAAHDPSAGSHMCEVCHVRFPLRRQLLKHLRNHKLMYICKECGRHFRNSSDAKEHYKCHAGVKYNCDHCGMVFSKYGSQVNHIRIHHGSATCDLCYEDFQGAKGLRAHKAKAHKETFQCGSCNLHFDNANALCKHTSMSSAGGCEPHIRPCRKCGENFELEELLNEHIIQQMHAKPKPGLKAPPKKKKCAAARLKRRKCTCKHDIDDNNIIGGKCPNYNLENAPKTESNLGQSNQITPSDIEPSFPSEVIDHSDIDPGRAAERVFPSDFELERALPSDLERERTVPSDFERERTCPCCKGERKVKVKIRRRAKTNPNVKYSRKKQKVMCEMCAVIFPSQATLRYHQRIHTGERPFQCAECPKSFRLKESLQTRTTLRYHQRIHTGERPFQCAECPKSFRRKENLQSHMHTHTGARPYPCTLCDKAFRSYSANYRHQLVHTKERRHRCTLCDKLFLTSTCVKMHVKTVHMKIPMPPRVRNRKRNLQ